MKILYVPCDASGSGKLRCELPGRELARLGHEVVFSQPRETTSWRNASGIMEHRQVSTPDLDVLEQRPDVMVLQKSIDPETPTIVESAQKLGAAVVVESDDLVWGVPDWHDAKRANDVGRAAHREGTQRADAVTVSTDQLAEEYRKVHPRVAVVRNGLDQEQWASVTPQYEVERDRMRVGWTGHLTWRRGDAATLERWLTPFLARCHRADFVAAGDRRVHDAIGVPFGQRISVGWQQWQDVPRLLCFDVGLVPLEDNLFNRCKSWLKGLEYMAAGIVPIAPAWHDEYRLLIEHGVDGVLVANHEQALASLWHLWASPEERVAMARRAREKALGLMVDGRAAEWERALSVRRPSRLLVA